MHRKDVTSRSRLILLLTLLAVCPASAQNERLCETADGNAPACLEQHWDNQTRDQFWYIDQGSLLMPVKWFKKLQEVQSQALSTAGLAKYGFITDFVDKKLKGVAGNFDRSLPLGFSVAKHWTKTEPYVGLTCAACHTGLIIGGGKKFMIDGAPSMVDFDRFLDELVKAMKDTLDNQTKWDAFAQIGGGANLKTNFQKRYEALKKRADADRPAEAAGPAGFGRLDAFGHIFNRVVTEHLGNEPDAIDQKSDAPASFPALWDIAQHSHVQWNYSAPNLGVGADAMGSLIRNVGEVLGVFGEVSFGLTVLGWSYSSTANIDNLQKIEGDIANLRSPAWPFGPLQDNLVQAGRKVALHAGCLGCHVEINRSHNDAKFQVPIVPIPIAAVGTEDLLDTLIRTRKGPVGKLAGAPTGALFIPIPGVTDSSFPASPDAKEDVAKLTAHLALNVLPQVGPDVNYVKKFRAFLAGYFDSTAKGVYKARPLNGIWATAPYLHNGSVASLKELLTPAQGRLKRFCVGDREFDTKDVGFKTYGGNCPDGKTTTVDTGTRGSSNVGHEFGVNLSDIDKTNLIEYLKSL